MGEKGEEKVILVAQINKYSVCYVNIIFKAKQQTAAFVEKFLF